MRKTVILLHPRVFDHKHSGVPLAPLMLAATLREAGFKPLIIDQATEENYQKTISRNLSDTLYVGVSAMTGSQIQFGLDMCDYIRKRSPDTPIVWGGRHASALPIQTLNDSRADIVVHGEGDFIAVEIAKAIAENSSLENVKGISFKKNDKIVTTPRTNAIRDLDSLPMIPWGLFDLEKYNAGRKEKTLSIQTGRGCPYSCTFCSHKIDKTEFFRVFSPTYILDNIEEAVKKYGINSVNLYEPFFVSKGSRVDEFCQGLIDRKLDISWIASARANNFWLLPAFTLKQMKKSGCHYLTFGFESGSQRILKRINKRIRIEDILKCAQMCHEYDIIPEACFIIGFPFETTADILATLKMVAQVRKLCPTAIFHIQLYTGFPGSILYNECIKRFGLKQIESLEEWGNFTKWRNNRAWLKRGEKSLLKLLNGSIYASSLEYLLSRPDLRLPRTGHFLISSAYRLYLSLFGQIIKEV
jgi:anaerobic magnesium-protoporphyrin IX monomethyl ester cyclase